MKSEHCVIFFSSFFFFFSWQYFLNGFWTGTFYHKDYFLLDFNYRHLKNVIKLLRRLFELNEFLASMGKITSLLSLLDIFNTRYVFTSIFNILLQIHLAQYSSFLYWSTDQLSLTISVGACVYVYVYTRTPTPIHKHTHVHVCLFSYVCVCVLDDLWGRWILFVKMVNDYIDTFISQEVKDSNLLFQNYFITSWI